MLMTTQQSLINTAFVAHTCSVSCVRLKALFSLQPPPGTPPPVQRFPSRLFQLKGFIWVLPQQNQFFSLLIVKLSEAFQFVIPGQIKKELTWLKSFLFSSWFAELFTNLLVWTLCDSASVCLCYNVHLLCSDLIYLGLQISFALSLH